MPPPGDNDTRKDNSSEASVGNVPPESRGRKLHPGFLEEQETSVFRPRIVGVKPQPDFRGYRNRKVIALSVLLILLMILVWKAFRIARGVPETIASPAQSNRAK
jgi:hypothetical protein